MFSRNVLLSINQLSERPQHQLRIVGNLLYHIISALFTAGIHAARTVPHCAGTTAGKRGRRRRLASRQKRWPLAPITVLRVW